MNKAESVLNSTYGFVPKPTEGEQIQHELLIDSNTFQEQQLKTDILRLALAADKNEDKEAAEIVLQRWNGLYPQNKYSSLKMLIGVEIDEDC